MLRWMVGGLMCSAILVQGAGLSSGAEPREVTYSELMVKPGDPALSKELAAKLATQKGLFAGPIAVGTGQTGTAVSGTTNCRPPLTDDTLKQMLENLGYTPQPVKLPTGESVFMLTVPRGTWTMRLSVGVTKDGKMVGIFYTLGNSVDPNKVESIRWQSLMENNVTLAPCVFAFHAQSKIILMYVNLKNLDISPAELRQWIDATMDVVIATHDKWKQLDAPAAGPM